MSWQENFVRLKETDNTKCNKNNTDIEQYAKVKAKGRWKKEYINLKRKGSKIMNDFLNKTLVLN